ncbi:LamG domain-containing protein [Pseudomonas sp. sp1636]|uniref:LamG domain-containing protein n=1 Tax=Pseudomonas sp. sp1636 TaxID=3036707 RepID=UPI0025A59396|nr:LamG domain-containing protein [Pseudomonas sp. sp1636]MDM8348181.1 LamG domain-containing protein [Pseudomonas sp. sp1636]
MRLAAIVLMLIGALCSPALLAASCPSVFPASITGTSSSQLDLSALTWQSSPALGASDRNLGAGNHYFGAGSTGNGWTLTASGGASTRVLVNGSLTLSNNSQLNAGGNPQNLILVVNGSLSLGNNVRIAGYVYATGGISFGNNLSLNGAITSLGATSTPGGNTSLTYNAAAIDLADFGGLCGAAAPPLLSWRMNESAWSGAAGEVLDSSANGLHGRAYNGASTAGTTPALAVDSNGYGTCRYGEFRSVDSRYLQIADSSLLDLGGSFTIGLWVRPASLPSSGLMSILSKDENYEFHLKPNGRINWWWQTTGPSATREFDSTAALPLNAWSHVAIRFSPGAQRIFINGVAAGSASFSGTPLLNNDPFQVGQDQGFAGRYFDGALDELRVYDRALSDAEILALIQERPALCNPAPDHYRLEFASNQALTCNPLAVTLRACQNSDCSASYANPVTASLTPAGNWSANPLSFTGSAAVHYRLTSAGSVPLGLSATPAASNPLRCMVGGLAGSCTVSFADSGFIFDVPNLLANRESAAVGLFAVRKDDSTLTCVPAFESGTRTLQFWFGYSDPNTGTRTVRVNGTPIADSAPGSDIDLDFSAGARTTIRVHYADAGSMTLNVRYAPIAGEEAGLVMSGADPFVSKPYGLLLQTDSTCSQAGVGSDCPLYPGGVRAGDPFSLRLQAVAWQADGEPLTAAELADNLVTPNFRLNNIVLGSQVLAPAGGNNGMLGVASYAHALGAQTSVSQSLSEVGVFQLSATPPANGYFGETVGGGQSGLVGRFAPAYLGAAGSASLTPSCGVFSYQGQPINFAIGQEPQLSVTGFNRGGGVTLNYDQTPFWRLNTPPRLDDVLDPDDDYASVTGTPALDAAGRLLRTGTASASLGGVDDGDGARSFRWSGEQLSYAPAVLPTGDELPFEAAIRLSFPASALTDQDGACYGAGGPCQGYAFDFGGSQLRLGRLSLGNAHGSELQGLDLALRLESWQAIAGGSFQVEAEDGCSAALLGMPDLQGFVGNLSNGETTPSLLGPSAGLGVVRLSAPGAGNDGAVQGYLPATPGWLLYDWHGSGRQAARGLARFGVYRGAAPLIFRRELYR